MKVILYRASGTRNISPFFRVRAFLDRFRGSQNGGYDPFYRAIYRTAISRTSRTEQFLAPPICGGELFGGLSRLYSRGSGSPRESGTAGCVISWEDSRRWERRLCRKLGAVSRETDRRGGSRA